jgi:hypothetical protein
MYKEPTIEEKIRDAKIKLGDDYGDEKMMEKAIFMAGFKDLATFIEQFTVFSSKDDIIIPKKLWKEKLQITGITKEEDLDV